MTIDQIRSAISFMEANYNAAMEADDLSLASAIYDKIKRLQNELIRAICAIDSNTTEADVRYFEGF